MTRLITDMRTLNFDNVGAKIDRKFAKSERLISAPELPVSANATVGESVGKS